MQPNPEGEMPPPPETPQPVEFRKRPLGLSVISFLWLIGGIVNLYFGMSTIIADVEVLPYLSNPAVHPWFKFGVPAEIAIYSLVLILGLLQLATIYGLWVGKPWSYRPALVIPIINSLVSWAAVALIYSAPSSLGLSSPIIIGSAVMSILWAVLYLSYLRRPHVKKYLQVKN